MARGILSAVTCQARALARLAACGLGVGASAAAAPGPEGGGVEPGPEVVVGIEAFADLADETTGESDLHQWFGQKVQNGELDALLQVDGIKSLFEDLAKTARLVLGRHQRIRDLFLAAHGRGVPLIQIGKELVGTQAVDIAAHQASLAAVEQRLWAVRGRQEEMADTSPGSPREMAEVPALAAERPVLEKERDRLTRWLQDIDTISLAMSPDADLVMIVCFAARSAPNAALTQMLGQCLLGRWGGYVQASRTGTGVSGPNNLETLIGLRHRLRVESQSGLKDWWKHGNQAIDKDDRAWFDENWVLLRIDPIPGPIAPLAVRFEPDALRVSAGLDTPLKASVGTLPDSGRVAFEWSAPGWQSAQPAPVFAVPKGANGLLPVILEVRDEQGRRGRGRVFLRVVSRAEPGRAVSTAAFVPKSGYDPPLEGAVRFRHEWDQPPDALAPGDRLELEFRVEELERRAPDSATGTSAFCWKTGVFVVAGKELIQAIGLGEEGNRPPDSGDAYEYPPSHVMTLAEATAGTVTEFVRADGDQIPREIRRWVPRMDGRLELVVPDKVIDVTTGQPSKPVSEGERLLVAVVAQGCGGIVYVETDFLYEFARGSDGVGRWQFVKSWIRDRPARTLDIPAAILECRMERGRRDAGAAPWP